MGSSGSGDHGRDVVNKPSVSFLDLGAMHAEIRPELDAIWDRAVNQSAFIGGADVDAFEASFASYTGRAHCIGTANGTDALELILAAHGIGAGDEVIVPGNTFIATAEAVVCVGATPVFCDVDPDTMLATPDTVAPHIGPRTAAIMGVDLYGQPIDFDGLEALAARHGLLLVEDAAQSHGGAWGSRPAGSAGRAAAFSFYPGKNLGAFGDGGAVVTDDASLAAVIRSVASHGRSVDDRYRHDRAGRNSRLDALQAAVLSAKLARLDHWNDQRRAHHALYASRLAGSGAQVVAVAPEARSVHHLEVVQVADRDLVMKEMAARGVPTSIHYPIPCHQQVPFAEFARDRLPVVEDCAPRLVSLPMHPALTVPQIDFVCDTLLDVMHDVRA